MRRHPRSAIRTRRGTLPARVPTSIIVMLTLALVLAVVARPAQTATAQAIPAASPASTTTASYELDARWDPSTNQIHGTASISYQNPSDDVLHELWFKLYLNAFRDEDTLWMRESSGAHRGSDYDSATPGWITLERLRLADTGEDLLPSGIDPSATVLQVPLPVARAVRPGETIRVEVAWTSQLPRVFARTGVADDFVMAGQWYPKLAVYDRGAWDTEPWHANSEFFADFGTYSLTLTVPATYVTGATGIRDRTTTNADGTTTTRYWAESVSDVAWTAWPGYRLVTTVIEAAGKPVELELLAPRSLPTATDERYIVSAKVALDLLGGWFGPYPWPKLTMVVPPDNAAGAGGMEYPMLVTLGLPMPAPFGISRGVRDPEVVTIHEIAHQWSPMQTATNEGREAWLDEGFADYATIRVLEAMYPPDRTIVDVGPFHIGYEALHRSQFLIAGVEQRLAQPSWEFDSFISYGVTVYSKGALVFRTLEQTVGEERFLAAMRGYFDAWRWRHPTTADLQQSLASELGLNLDSFFEQLVLGTDVLDYDLTAISPDGATIRRRGDVAIPVQIAMTYADGRVDIRDWDGRNGPLELVAAGGQLRSVQIDPDRALRVEAFVLDNAREVAPSPMPLAAVAARLLGLIQAVMLAGMLG